LGTIAGPANLRVPTLADRLVEASPGSRVVSLSGKDRGAIFLAGKTRGTSSTGTNRDSGRYVSSPRTTLDGIAGSAARDLVKQFTLSRPRTLVSRFGTLWKPLAKPAAPRLAATGAQHRPLSVPDLGIGFDHDLTLRTARLLRRHLLQPLPDQMLPIWRSPSR